MRDIETSQWDSVSGANVKPGSTGAAERNREVVESLSEEWTGRIRSAIEALQELYRAGLT